MSRYHVHIKEEKYTGSKDNLAFIERQLNEYLEHYSGETIYVSTVMPLATITADDKKTGNSRKFMSDLERTVDFVEKVEEEKGPYNITTAP